MYELCDSSLHFAEPCSLGRILRAALESERLYKAWDERLWFRFNDVTLRALGLTMGGLGVGLGGGSLRVSQCGIVFSICFSRRALSSSLSLSLLRPFFLSLSLSPSLIPLSSRSEGCAAFDRGGMPQVGFGLDVDLQRLAVTLPAAMPEKVHNIIELRRACGGIGGGYKGKGGRRRGGGLRRVQRGYKGGGGGGGEGLRYKGVLKVEALRVMVLCLIEVFGLGPGSRGRVNYLLPKISGLTFASSPKTHLAYELGLRV